MEPLEKFLIDAKTAWEKFKKSGPTEVGLVFHDDADGISSAAIVFSFLEKEGYNARLICLEKLYREVVTKLHERFTHVIYCDLGSPHLEEITKVAPRDGLTLVLDHHDPLGTSTEYVLDLNLERYGYRGESDFSGSICSLLFAISNDPSFWRLGPIALVGAAELPKKSKICDFVLSELRRRKLVGKKIEWMGFTIPRLFSLLQVLGSVGYYVGGPEAGISLCLKGDEKAVGLAEELEVKRKLANRELLSYLRSGGMEETEHIQYFEDPGYFNEMGSKVIGTFCSYLSYQKFVAPMKYIFGFMRTKRMIPNFGLLDRDYVKVSARAPSRLKKLIENSTTLSCVELLREAIIEDEVADGHEFAASAAIIRSPREFVESCEKVLEKSKRK